MEVILIIIGINLWYIGYVLRKILDEIKKEKGIN